MRVPGKTAAISLDAIDFLSRQFLIETWPTVLNFIQRHESESHLRAAEQRGAEELVALGLLDKYGDVDESLMYALNILMQPELELALRFYGNTRKRICLAGKAGKYVFAQREEDTILIANPTIRSHADLAEYLAGIFAESSTVIDFNGIRCLTNILSERLDKCSDLGDYLSVLLGFGASEKDARVAATVLSRCATQIEMVAYVNSVARKRISPAAVAIFDSDYGRVVASPMVSHSGQVWTTISPGTRHRIERSIIGLLDSIFDSPHVE